VARGGAGRGAALNAQVALRKGVAGDRAFVLDLGRRTTIDSVSSMRHAPSAFVEASYEQLVAFALGRSHVLLIAETDLAGPVGFVLMLDDLPDEVTGLPQGFVAYMAVEPEARRHGVGKHLLAAAEDAARAKRLPFVALMVTEDNAAARELYAQAGYVTERRLMCKAL
jgi:ribosomal protein S18 acetylase RimI-like enzyme